MPVSELLENNKKQIPRSVDALYQSGKEAVHDPDAEPQNSRVQEKNKKIDSLTM